MIVAFASQKGGSGKSSLALALAEHFARVRKSTISIIDADPQETSVEWMRVAESYPDNPLSKAIEVIPVKSADLHLRDLSEGRELTFIDCPGLVNDVLRSALLAADLVVIPVQPTYADSKAMPKIYEQLALAQQHRQTPLAVRVLLNRVRPSTRLAKSAPGDLQASFPAGVELLRCQLRDLEEFKLFLGRGDGPTGEAAKDVTALAGELRALLFPRRPTRKEAIAHAA